ncbi:Protein of unknown function [Nocardioides exalbidus]|uniref:DinB family protein n=1 Tax=Nocardioides exalbidus TaxID=402596 RepID=A0A1H5ADV6_9ACTN|nr:DinB family protein [Nocardioides exalbidus]SED40255.1 Protein of unknown function [Nocardioides exalbidus]
MAAVADEGWPADLVGRVDELIDDYRAALRASLDGLTEEQARARLVPSKTTLLGLLKHVTYVEGVWFDQAVTGHTAKEAGIATGPDRSFTLRKSDTIESVLATHADRVEQSRRAMAGLDPGATVTGRGERAVWALKLQVLRELAHHAGHADILREQLLAGADPAP